MSTKLELLTAADVKQQVLTIQEVMKTVMKQDEHYGIIPGTSKFTLYQTGAQKLLATFRLGSDPEIVNTVETSDSVSYQVKVRLFNISDQNTVGYGMGECSTLEEKYSWRAPKSEDEFNAAPENGKRIKYYKDNTANQVKIPYKDVANTVLKMAIKRALVAAVLTATAAGDIFTQDLEDLDDDIRDGIISAEATNAARKTTTTSQNLADIQAGVQLLGLKSNVVTEGDKKILIVFGKTSLAKEGLQRLGFLKRKQPNSEYMQTYMDVTHLVSQNITQPQQPAKTNNATDCKRFTNYTEFVKCLNEKGIQIEAKDKNKKTWVKITQKPENIAESLLAELGFQRRGEDLLMEVTHLIQPPTQQTLITVDQKSA